MTTTRLRFQLLTFALMRTIINTGYRMIYPFIVPISRGLGVDVIAISQVISLRSMLGLFSPVLGLVPDRWGRKTAMLIGVGMFAGGLLVVTVWTTFPALMVALLLSASGKYLFDPSMQVYLGDLVPYHQRGRAIAITELGWSLSFILGMPFVAWLMARGGWTLPFPVIAGLTGITLILLWRTIPDSGERHTPQLINPLTILNYPAALGGLAVGLLISMANEIISVVYGVWMESGFGLQVTGLGLAAAVIGTAELIGEGGVAALADRLGKRRAVLIGIGLNSLMGLALPFLGHNVAGALAGLFLFYLTFEFSLVSSIPLMTELAPEARAVLMAGNIAALSGGRMMGALAGPFFFRYGIVTSGLASAGVNLMAVLTLLLFIQSRHDPGQPPEVL